MDKLKRKSVQIMMLISNNSYFKGWFEGNIYKGKTKSICVPGLNCYSCPGALGSCPIGSLQAVIADMRYNFSFYVVGYLTIIGLVAGRFVCGWLCPFGLIQELIYKIPSPKIKLGERFKWLIYIKYVILLVFVIFIPMILVNDIGMGDPAFCKYICPAGTLEGGIPLFVLNQSLRSAAGYLFMWKMGILIAIAVLSIVIFRAFCRFICPLGAIYSIFNPISIYRFEIDKSICTNCSACAKKCKMEINVNENPNSLECIRCGDCKNSCPENAIKTVIRNKY